MTGPLASWVSIHAKVDPAVLAAAREEGDETSEKVVIDVVRELALCSYPDGTSVYAPTWDELAERTRTSRSTVGAALKIAVRAGLLSVERRGRGRGHATVYRVTNITLCEPPSSCPAACKGLAVTLAEMVQVPDLSQPEARHRKRPGAGRKGPGAGPTTYERGPTTPQGGRSPQGESAAPAPSHGSGASEPGQQEQEPAGSGEPTRAVPDWQGLYELVKPGRPRTRRSSAEERAAEEAEKRALALRIVTESRQQTGPSLNERSSA